MVRIFHHTFRPPALRICPQRLRKDAERWSSKNVTERKMSLTRIDIFASFEFVTNESNQKGRSWQYLRESSNSVLSLTSSSTVSRLLKQRILEKERHERTVLSRSHSLSQNRVLRTLIGITNINCPRRSLCPFPLSRIFQSSECVQNFSQKSIFLELVNWLIFLSVRPSFRSSRLKHDTASRTWLKGPELDSQFWTGDRTEFATNPAIQVLSEEFDSHLFLTWIVVCITILADVSKCTSKVASGSGDGYSQSRILELETEQRKEPFYQFVITFLSLLLPSVEL